MGIGSAATGTRWRDGRGRFRPSPMGAYPLSAAEQAAYDAATTGHHWVVWAYPQGSSVGREFGVDCETLEEAQRVKARYAAYWPHVRYVIRRRRGQALASS